MTERVMSRTRADEQASGGWEHTVVARVANGESAALTELVDQFGSAVFGVSLWVVGDDVGATAVTGAVYRHVWTHPQELLDTEPTGVGADSLRGRLVTMAHRRALAWIRAHPGRMRTPLKLRAQWPEESAVPAPDELTAAKSATAHVHDAYAALPAHERTALEAVYLHGQSCATAAAQLSVTPAVLRERLVSALRHLADSLSVGRPTGDQP